MLQDEEAVLHPVGGGGEFLNRTNSHNNSGNNRGGSLEDEIAMTFRAVFAVMVCATGFMASGMHSFLSVVAICAVAFFSRYLCKALGVNGFSFTTTTPPSEDNHPDGGGQHPPPDPNRRASLTNSRIARAWHSITQGCGVCLVRLAHGSWRTRYPSLHVIVWGMLTALVFACAAAGPALTLYATCHTCPRTLATVRDGAVRNISASSSVSAVRHGEEASGDNPFIIGGAEDASCSLIATDVSPLCLGVPTLIIYELLSIYVLRFSLYALGVSAIDGCNCCDSPHPHLVP